MRKRALVFVIPLLLAGAAIAVGNQTARADSGAVPSSTFDCMNCHGNPDLSMTLPDNETTSLHVSATIVQQSVHGQIGCEGCHTGYDFPHPTVAAQDRFDYEKAAMATCRKCHPAEVAGLQSSVHAGLQGMGIVCQDCHGSHDIQPAQAASLRATTLALCTGCHQNQELMQQYGLSSSVVTTYLKDFHGRTSLLQAEDSQKAWINEAVCIDCHGVHNILSVDSPNSQVIRDNLTATCQKCHETATPNFPSGWMAHYAPSASRTPLVFLARTFYWIMIPFTVIGLMIHIGIDIRHHRRSSKAKE
jgi:predicted CXXCH cytochrome family protein